MNHNKQIGNVIVRHKLKNILAGMFLVPFMVFAYPLYSQSASHGYDSNIRKGDEYYNQKEYEKAMGYYMAALQTVGNRNNEELQSKIDNCRRMTDEQKCEVTFVSDYDRTSLKINKVNYGFLPLKVSLPPGFYKLEFKSNKPRKSCSDQLEIYSSAPINYRPMMLSNKDKITFVYPEGLWFTANLGLGGVSSKNRLQYGLTVGHRPISWFGYYLQGWTTFTSGFADIQAGVTFSYSFASLKLGAGYRYVGVKRFEVDYPHNLDLTAGLVFSLESGLALSGDITLVSGKKYKDFLVGLGVGWDFSDYR